jgi:hypothetical protein
MTNNLKKVLITEGISQAALSRQSRVSTTTVGKLYNKSSDFVSDTKKGALVRGINDILNSEKYSFSDIFGEI